MRLLHPLRIPLRNLRKAYREARQFAEELYLTLITYWEGDRGFRLRYRYHKRHLGAIGPGCRIDVGVHFEHPEQIFLGSRVHLDRNCYLVGGPKNLDLSQRDLKRVENPVALVEVGMLVVGDDCHLSQGTMVFAHGGVRLGALVTLSAGVRVYSLSSLPDSPNRPGCWSSIQPYSGSSPTLVGPVSLGQNVWLGLDVLVFPGVDVGEDSFVRSRSVVTRSCAPNSILAGDPARFRRFRFTERRPSE